MKQLILLVSICLLSLNLNAQTDEELAFQLDSLEQSFTYQTGTIELNGGIGTIDIPEGFKYLDAEQAEFVLTDLWGNPKGDDLTLGFVLRENHKLMSDTGYVFNIQYDAIGYVEDDDAEDIDYEDLLKDMKEETDAANKHREELGYEPVKLVGWAANPYYDSERKILHWAKEIKFGTEEINTLNYNIRILGRKGVILLNAVGTMPNLNIVKKDLPHVLDIVSFNEGFRYADFNPNMDQVAKWSIGGLVAGKVLAKAGVFTFLLKFWKIIALAVAGFFGTFWKRLTNKE